MRMCLWAAAILAILPSWASAGLVTNGGFEVDVCLPSAVCYPPPTGWTVTTGPVELITFWAPHSGSNSVDLNANSPGGIKQDIDTIAGVRYDLTFWLAGNPCCTTLKTLRAIAGSVSQDFTFDITGKSITDMGWVVKTLSFTASASSTTIEFRSLDASSSAWGPVIDDVSVTASDSVPEPGTVWLAGLAGAAILAFRRRCNP